MRSRTGGFPSCPAVPVSAPAPRPTVSRHPPRLPAPGCLPPRVPVDYLQCTAREPSRERCRAPGCRKSTRMLARRRVSAVRARPAPPHTRAPASAQRTCRAVRALRARVSRWSSLSRPPCDQGWLGVLLLDSADLDKLDQRGVARSARGCRASAGPIGRMSAAGRRPVCPARSCGRARPATPRARPRRHIRWPTRCLPRTTGIAPRNY